MADSLSHRPRPRASRWLERAALSVLVVAILIGLSRSRGGPKLGSDAAAFDLPSITMDERVRLADFNGSPVVLEVFASWCAACRRAAPTVKAAAAAMRARPVAFVGVSVDSDAATARSAVARWGITYPVALDDGTFVDRYGVTTLPTFIVLDAQGKVRHAAAGVPSDAELEGWLAEVGAPRR